MGMDVGRWHAGSVSGGGAAAPGCGRHAAEADRCRGGRLRVAGQVQRQLGGAAAGAGHLPRPARPAGQPPAPAQPAAGLLHATVLLPALRSPVIVPRPGHAGRQTAHVVSHDERALHMPCDLPGNMQI